MKHVCTTCDQKFDDIPAGAIQLTPGERRINIFRFPDGTIHSLRKVKGLTEGFHRRWHKTPRPDCVFCFPPPKPEPPVEQPVLVQQAIQAPVPVMESQEVAQVLGTQPEVVAEIEDESELTSITTMSRAFNRIRKLQ
jgi:hypothetical protein